MIDLMLIIISIVTKPAPEYVSGCLGGVGAGCGAAEQPIIIIVD